MAGMPGTSPCFETKRNAVGTLNDSVLEITINCILNYNNVAVFYLLMSSFYYSF